mgnify:CR=1 FL=1
MDNSSGFNIYEKLLIDNPIRFDRRILIISYPVPNIQYVCEEELIPLLNLHILSSLFSLSIQILVEKCEIIV